MKILANAIARQPILSDVDALTEQARNQIVRSVGDEGGGTIHGTEVSRELASEITAQRRRQGEDVHLAGMFTVKKNDTTYTDGFRVTLIDVSSGEEITAFLQDVMISEQHRKVIQEAEWKRTPFYAEIAARKIGTRLVDALIVNALEEPAEAG